MTFSVDCTTFIEWINKCKYLKTVSTSVDFAEFFDVAFKVRECDTRIYLNNPDLHANMRRGLTFLKEGRDHIMLRQGLPKFFDYDFADISKDNSTLVPVSSYPVRFYNLEKVNGENAQISWCVQHQKWTICSKNVSLLASDYKDVERLFLNSQRFSFAAFIARHWFEGTLPNVKNVDALKQLLESYTLVGEVCDVSNQQHIVDNPLKHGLVFFALVPRQPPPCALCMPPSEAVAHFDAHGLKHVDYNDSLLVESKADIEKLRAFVDRATADPSDDPYKCLSEGAVMYAVDEANSRVLFMAKIKTTKYRILRRMREVMKRVNPSDALSTAKIRRGFSGDIRKWSLQAAKSDYLLLFDAACFLKLREVHQWNAETIGHKFVDFLHACIAAMEVMPPRIVEVSNGEDDTAPKSDNDGEAMINPECLKVGGEGTGKGRGNRRRKQRV